MDKVKFLNPIMRNTKHEIIMKSYEKFSLKTREQKLYI